MTERGVLALAGHGYAVPRAVPQIDNRIRLCRVRFYHGLSGRFTDKLLFCFLRGLFRAPSVVKFMVMRLPRTGGKPSLVKRVSAFEH